MGGGISDLTPGKRDEMMADVARQLEAFFDPRGTGDNMFFLLVVSRGGASSNCRTIRGEDMPALLRLYADQMERA